jgi:hypothetical protein
MNSADLVIQKALVYLLSGMDLSWSINPTDESMPYGVFVSTTETDAFRSKTMQGSENTFTLRIYSASQIEARQLAADTIALITAAPLNLEGNHFAVGKVRLDINQTVNDRTERGDVFSSVLRFRLKVGYTP